MAEVEESGVCRLWEQPVPKPGGERGKPREVKLGLVNHPKDFKLDP